LPVIPPSMMAGLAIPHQTLSPGDGSCAKWTGPSSFPPREQNILGFFVRLSLPILRRYAASQFPNCASLLHPAPAIQFPPTFLCPLQNPCFLGDRSPGEHLNTHGPQLASSPRCCGKLPPRFNGLFCVMSVNIQAPHDHDGLPDAGGVLLSPIPPLVFP